jgi:hypothetical protein
MNGNLILSLIDRLKDLIRLRDAQSRAVFDEYIEPLMVNFEELHDKYTSVLSEAVTSFQQNRMQPKQISETGFQMAERSAATITLRSRIFAASTIFDKKCSAWPLVESIMKYLTSASGQVLSESHTFSLQDNLSFSEPDDRPLFWHAMNTLMVVSETLLQVHYQLRFTDESEDQIRVRLGKQLSSVLEQLQDDYQSVRIEFESLRKRMYKIKL